MLRGLIIYSKQEDKLGDKDYSVKRLLQAGREKY